MGVIKRRIPHEIKSYKSTMFFGFTTRQVICMGIAAVLIVPTFILNKSYLHLDSDLFGYVIMIEAIPCAACGWFSYNDMPIEKIAVKIFNFFFGARRRKWIWESDETKIQKAVMKIRYEELEAERKQEIEDEKNRIKEEKLNRKKSAKEKKKNARTVRSKN